MGNYKKCRIRRFNSNNKLLHTRLVPNNISNKYGLSYYTETHSNSRKNDLLDFLEFLKWERWREESGTYVFILIHSITELHPVYQDNLSLVSTIFKSFTNHTPRLHFWTKKNTKIFDSQKFTLQPCKNHTHKPGIILSKQPEAQELQNLMVALLSQPYM